jgi:CHAD domain-containing protein
MTYRLTRNDRSLTAAIRRIAREQIDCAINELGDTDVDRHETVHQVRKRFKKIRGLVRLTRPAFEQTYKFENAWFRDAGREFSAVRDAEAGIETYDGLLSHYEDELDRGAFGPIRRKLTLRRRYIADKKTDLDQQLEDLRAALGVARERIDEWHLEADGFSACKSGVAKTYSRGQQAMATAYAEPSAENFHEWRKRAKYHWYHMRLLRDVWKPVMKQRRDMLKQLTTHLGDEHDLAEFRRLLVEQADRFGDDKTRNAMLALIDRRRTALQAQAKPLGQRLYAEKTRHFVTRLGRYWDVWQLELHD